MMMAAIKCPICKNRKSCEIMGMGDSAIQNCGMYCTDEPPRRSNGDVIRAMTDEELAGILAMQSVVSPPWCAENFDCPYADQDPVRCDLCALDWLRKEAPK